MKPTRAVSKVAVLAVVLTANLHSVVFLINRSVSLEGLQLLT